MAFSLNKTLINEPCFSLWTKFSDTQLTSLFTDTPTLHACCGVLITDLLSYIRHMYASHKQVDFTHIDNDGTASILFSLSKHQHFMCPCGVKTTTIQKLSNHLDSAHHARHAIEKTRILQMPLAQGNMELTKLLRKRSIRTRLALLEHAEGVSTFNLTEWTRDTSKGPTICINMSENNLVYKHIGGLESAPLVCFSSDNENDFLLKILESIVDSKLPRAQSIDFSLLGYKVGSITADPTPALDTLFTAGGIFSFLRGFWLASTEAKGWLLVGCASAMFSKDKLRMAFLEHAQSIVQMMTTPMAQSNSTDALKALFVLFGLVTFKIIPKASNIEGFVKAVGAMGTFSLGMMRSVDGVTRLVEWFRTAGFKSLFGFALEEDDIRETREMYENIRSEVTDLVSNEQLHDAAYCRRVKALHTKFTHLYSESDMYALPNDFRQTLTFLNSKITKLMDRVTAAGTLGAGTRIEPVVLSLKGPAGIGKSHVAFAFVAKAIKKLAPECKDWQEELYVRNQSQEFWDSYHGQSVTMYDDFGQLVDTVAKPNPEFIELIKSQNIVRFPLHMASIEDKSNTFFCSRLIVLTSNLGEFTTKSLSSNEALQRRIEMDIELRPRKLVGGKIVIVGHPDPRDYDYVYKDGRVLDAEGVLKDLFARLDVKENRSAEFTKMMNDISASDDFTDFGFHADVRYDTAKPPPTVDFSRPPPPIVTEDLMNLEVDDLEVMVAKLEQDVPLGQGALRDIAHFLLPILDLDYATPATANGYSLGGKEVPWDGVAPLPAGAQPVIIGYRSMQKWFTTLGRLMTLYQAYRILSPLIAKLFSCVLPKRTPASTESGVVDSHHANLPLGKLVKHRHLCVVCTREYSHEHVIVHPTEQRERGYDVCPACRSLVGQRESVVQEIVGPKTRPFTGQSEEFLKDVNRRMEEHVEEVAISRTRNTVPPTFARPGYFNKVRGTMVPVEEPEAYDCGATPKPAPTRVEAYDDGRTLKPQPRQVQKYDDGMTPKPAARFVQSAVTRPHSVAVMMIKNQLVNSKRYTEMDDDLRQEYDRVLTTAHVENLRIVRKMVYDVAYKYRLNLPDLDLHAVQSHDMSKFDEVEIIGFTGKHHMNEHNEEFFASVAAELGINLSEVVTKLWQKACQHHEGQQPVTDTKSATALQKLVCEVIAAHCVQQGVEIPPWETAAEVVLRDENMKKMRDEEVVYLRTLLRNETVSLEGIVDHNARLLTLSLDKNQYTLFAGFEQDQNELTRVQSIVFLRGKTALINAHSLALIADATWFRIINPIGRTYTFPAKECELRAFNTKRCDDIGIIVFPRQCPDHPDITQHFIKSDQVGRFTSVSATLLTHQYTPPGLIMAVRHVVVAKLETDRSYLTTDGAGTHAKTLAQCYTYGAVTVPGDCGSLLVATNTAVPNKILGFHCWGYSDGRGGAFVITKDEIDKILACVPARAQTAMPIFGKFDGPELDGTNYLGLGMVIPAPVATKTKLVRTEMSYREPLTAPAHLRPTRQLDPLKKAMVKYSCATPAIDPTMLAQAVKDVERVLFNGDRRAEYAALGKLSTNDAVAGVAGMPFMDSLNRTTSPGYPYVLQPRAKRGKQDWISEDMVVSDELRNDIDRRLTTMALGKRCPAIWMDNLKDERRPKEKVAAGKTRVFTGGPMDYTIVFRSFFLAFSSFVMHNRIGNEIAVGVNPFEEWGPLARKLKRNGDYMIAGDFSLYDSTLHSQILWSILDIVNHFHKDEHSDTRHLLWLEIVNSIHLCRGQVYSIDHGNPSGNPITSIVNSLFNMIIVRLVYMHVTGKSVDTFVDNVSFITYGDDNVMGVSPEVHELFNQDTVTEGFKYFGMIYTREDKTTTAGGFRSVTEVSFLKRGFVDQGRGYWAAPLSLDTVLEIPLWIKTQVDIEENVIDNCETSFRELALHGREIYNYWTSVIAENFAQVYNGSLAALPYEAQYELVTQQKLGMGRIGMTVIESQQSLNPSGQRRAISAYQSGGGVFTPIDQCLPPKT